MKFIRKELAWLLRGHGIFFQSAPNAQRQQRNRLFLTPENREQKIIESQKSLFQINLFIVPEYTTQLSGKPFRIKKFSLFPKYCILNKGVQN
jgi:hypothetical protein